MNYISFGINDDCLAGVLPDRIEAVVIVSDHASDLTRLEEFVHATFDRNCRKYFVFGSSSETIHDTIDDILIPNHSKVFCLTTFDDDASSENIAISLMSMPRREEERDTGFATDLEHIVVLSHSKNQSRRLVEGIKMEIKETLGAISD